MPGAQPSIKRRLSDRLRAFGQARDLGRRIRLTDIALVIERVMDAHETRPVSGLDVVLEVDGRARASAADEIARLTGGTKAVA